MKANIYKQILNNWWLLKISYGLGFVFSALDKIFGLVIDWNIYGIPTIVTYLTSDIKMILLIRGIVELIIGILLFSTYTYIAAIIASFWLFLSACYVFASSAFIDTAARYLLIGICAITLASLTKIKQELEKNKLQ